MTRTTLLWLVEAAGTALAETSVGTIWLAIDELQGPLALLFQALLPALELLNLPSHHEQSHLCFVGGGVHFLDVIAGIRIHRRFHLADAIGDLGVALHQLVHLGCALADQDIYFLELPLDLVVFLPDVLDQCLQMLGARRCCECIFA